MSETLETKARRIGDDVTAIWDLLQSKGGVIPHAVNTENLVDVLEQVTALNRWAVRGLFMYDSEGNYLDFYTYHEVLRMEELPEPPAGSVWTMTLQQVKAKIIEAQHYVCLVADTGAVDFDMALKLVLTASKKSPTIALKIDSIGSGAAVLQWGDGNSEVIVSDTAQRTWNHTYSEAGEYTITVSLPDGATMSFMAGSQTNSYYYLFGSSSNQSNYASTVKEFLYTENLKFKVPSGSGFFYMVGPGYFDVVQRNRWQPSSSQRSQITVIPQSNIYDESMTAAFSGAQITNASLKTGDKLSTAMFCGCNLLTNFSSTDAITEVPDYTFYYCSALTTTNIDFSNLTRVGAGAFTYAKCIPETLDLRNCTSVGVAAFRGANLKKVKLGAHTVTYGDEYAGQGATFGNTSTLTEVTIEPGCTSIGTCCFEASPNLVFPTIPSSVKTIGTSAFRGVRNIDMRTLPDDGITTFSGFQGAYVSHFYIPQSVETFEGRACSDLHTENPETVVLGNVRFTTSSSIGVTYDSPLMTVDASNASIEAYWSSSGGGVFLNGNVIAIALPGRADSKQYGSRQLGYMFNGMNAYVQEPFSMKDYVYPMVYARYDSTQPLTNIALTGYNFNNASFKSVTFRQNVTAIGACDFKAFGRLAGYTGWKGSFPIECGDGDTYTYTIRFTANTSIPTLPSYAPGDNNAPFFVGSVQYSNYSGYPTISYVPKIVVPDALYNDWIAASNWSQWAQYIVRESDE